MVEVRGADLDQFDQGRVQARAGGGVEADESAEDLRGRLGEVEAGAVAVFVFVVMCINLWGG